MNRAAGVGQTAFVRERVAEATPSLLIAEERPVTADPATRPWAICLFSLYGDFRRPARLSAERIAPPLPLPSPETWTVRGGSVTRDGILSLQIETYAPSRALVFWSQQAKSPNRSTTRYTMAAAGVHRARDWLS